LKIYSIQSIIEALKKIIATLEQEKKLKVIEHEEDNEINQRSD
jgi:hypothetical protein